MNDNTFISRWSRLKSERATQTKTSTDATEKQEITSLKTDDLTSELAVSELAVSELAVSGLSPSNLPEAATAFLESLADERPSELSSLISDNDQSDERSQDHSPNNNPNNNPALTDIPILTDEDMPPIEGLGENSDFSQFLSSGVSDQLRNLALRKLFNLPQFNVRDGLNDYDEDFSKIPVLAQEVAAKMRSWLHEKQDQLTSELEEELKEELNEALTEDQAEKPSIDAADEPSATAQLSSDRQKDTNPVNANTPDNRQKASPLAAANIKDFIETVDNLGDADLEG